MQAPEARTRAIFINRFHVHVPLTGPGLRANDFRKEGFRGGVAVQNAILAAFLVIDDELHGDAGAAGPFCMGRAGAVTEKIARIWSHASGPAVG